MLSFRQLFQVTPLLISLFIVNPLLAQERTSNVNESSSINSTSEVDSPNQIIETNANGEVVIKEDDCIVTYRRNGKVKKIDCSQ